MNCNFCGKNVDNDIGHWDAIDENKIMCVECYKEIVN